MEQQIEGMQAKLEEAKERSGVRQVGETATEEKGNASIVSALASRTKEVSRDTDEPVKSLSPAEAIKMLQKYGIIDELATGELVSTVDYRVGQTKEYKQNPISEISKDLMYHFMMYKDGVEGLNDYPYIDKIIELYRRANTDQQELQAQGLAKLNDDLDALNNGLQEVVASALTGQKAPQQESRVKTLKRLPVRCLEAFSASGAKIADVETCRENIMAVNPVDKKLIAFLYTSEITPNRLNVANGNGWTPLMNLARYATAEDCKKLVEAGADINARNKDGNTALMLATCNKEDGEAICDLLLKAGAGINEKNNDGWTPLMWVARYSSPEVCKVLIEARADINARNKDGSTALMLATCNSENASSICDLLIQNRAEIDARDNDGDTSLIWSIRSSTEEVCKKLIKAGATLDTTTPRGKQVFMQSVLNAQTAVCEILIKAGANVNEKGEDGLTALIAAAMAGNSDTVKLLLDAGANVNSIATTTGKKQTAIDLVRDIVADLSNPLLGSLRRQVLEKDVKKVAPHAELDYKGTLKLLEERGGKSISEMGADSGGVSGDLDVLITSLRTTQYHTDVERLYQRRLLEILPRIKNGADVNTVLDNANGTTALHNACGLSCVDIVRWLLGHGADLNMRTAKGASVYDCVGGENATEIRAILHDAQNVSSSQGTPLAERKDLQPMIDRMAALRCCEASSALYQKRLLTLLPMIRDGSDVDVTLPETKGNTALHYACAIGSWSITQWLVEHGANVNAVTDKGATPLDCVGDDNAQRIRALLISRGAKKAAELNQGGTFTQPNAGGGTIPEDAEALNNLGLAYQFGKGKPKNYAEAARCFRRAAEQGHAGAQNNLGFLYHNGWGVPQDYSQAAYWYRLSAQQGNAWGQSNYGTCLEFGWGVRKDLSTAIEMYRRAASQGHASAKKHLKRHGILM